MTYGVLPERVLPYPADFAPTYSADFALTDTSVATNMARAEGTTTLAFSVSKKRPARVFFVALIVSILYFALFPYPLGREIVARPVWSVTLPDPGSPQPSNPRGASVSAPDSAKAIAAPFQLGDLFGFAAANGDILYAEKTLFRVALSQAGFVNYTRLGMNWMLQNVRGARVISFSGYGYPLLSSDGGRIFVVKADLSGIIELDRAGDVIWSRDFPAMLTTVSVPGDSLLVGLLNGTLLLLNGRGSPVYEHVMGGSRLPVILGAVVSADGSLMASVSGIAPQFLTVLRRQGTGFGEIAKEVLASDFRREVRMSFSPDSRYLLIEGERAAGMFDPAAARLAWLPLSGGLADVSFPGSGRLAAMAARDGTLVELRILRPFTAPILKETFTAQQLFLGTVEGDLLLGLDGRLLRIGLEAL